MLCFFAAPQIKTSGTSGALTALLQSGKSPISIGGRPITSSVLLTPSVTVTPTSSPVAPSKGRIFISNPLTKKWLNESCARFLIVEFLFIYQLFFYIYQKTLLWQFYCTSWQNVKKLF